MIWGMHFQTIKGLAFLCGYGCLFYYGMIALYEYVIRDDKRTKCGGMGYWRCVGILALLWLPHLIVKIPGALGVHPRYCFPIVYSVPFIFGCYMLERNS